MQSSHTRLRAGTATIDITPAISEDAADRIYLSGYVARTGHAVGVHDPLSARALALSDGTRRAVLVVCDLIGLEARFSAEVRREIGEVTGTPADAVMLACTHTHSGPATLKLHQCGAVSSAYLEYLRRRVISVAKRAAAAMRPVRLAAGSAALPKGAYNRRRDGREIDTEVGIGWLRDLRGESVALMVNYGCHPVMLGADNLWISADYPGAAVRALEAAFGGTAFFLTGADGDVDPAVRAANVRGHDSFEDVDSLGQALADVVIQTLADTERFAGQPVSTVYAASEELALPLGPALSVAQLRRVRAVHEGRLAGVSAFQETVEAKIQRAMVAWAHETLVQVQHGTTPTTISAPVQVIRAGDLALVGIPGELFSALGRRIKEALPHNQVFIVGYANQDIGYIPDRAAYDKGGYEVDEAYKYYGYPAALAPEAGEMIVATSIRLAQADSESHSTGT